MKSKIAVLASVLALAFVGSAWAEPAVDFVDTTPKRTVKVEVADTREKTELGLMYRANLPEGRGMWFVFPVERRLFFWMKNVSFPIDIIFLDANHNIRKIWNSVPPCEKEPCPVYPSAGPAKYALEVPAGYCEKYGVKENQKVKYHP